MHLSFFVSCSHAPRDKRDKEYVHDTYVDDDPLTVPFPMFYFDRKKKKDPRAAPFFLPPFSCCSRFLSVQPVNHSQTHLRYLVLVHVQKKTGSLISFPLRSFCSTHEECMKKNRVAKRDTGK